MRLSARGIFLAGGILSLFFGTTMVLAATPVVKITASVKAGTQPLKSNVVIIATVTSPEAGWLVIHASDNKQPATVLGYVKVPKGTSKAVRVKLTNTKAVTKLVLAMLHRDLGKKGVYEFPGKDVPTLNGTQVVMANFQLSNVTNPVTPIAPKPTPANTDASNKTVPTTTKTDGTNPTMNQENAAPNGTTPSPGVTNDNAPLGSMPPPVAPLKEFNITAKLWSFEPATITVNKGDKVRLKITSLDVEHGFAIWEYNIKQSIPAGKSTTVEFLADQVGTFTYFCSVFCGSGHGGMGGQLIVK